MLSVLFQSQLPFWTLGAVEVLCSNPRLRGGCRFAMRIAECLTAFKIFSSAQTRRANQVQFSADWRRCDKLRTDGSIWTDTATMNRSTEGRSGRSNSGCGCVFVNGTNSCEKHNRKSPVSLHGADNFGNTSCVAEDISVSAAVESWLATQLLVSGVFAWSYRLEHKACWAPGTWTE